MQGGWRLGCRKLIRFRIRLSLLARRRRALHLFIICAISTYLLREPIFESLSYAMGRANRLLHKDVVERKLCLLQVLFRHGHRSPFSLYPTDPNPKSWWVEGLGQLTQLGKLQHYVVGEYLRKTYNGFITSNSKEVHCLSSGASRCLFGAYSLVAAMYPPPADKLIRENLTWQPIPVEYTKESEDQYLQSSPNCPLAEKERYEVFDRPEALAFITKHKHLYEFWANNSGQEILHYDHAGNLYKTLNVEKTYNLTIPDWAKETWDELRIQGDYSYYFHFRTKLLHRLRAGPLLGRILEKWRLKIANPRQAKKVYLYSGHGSNLVAVLQSIDLFNMKIPPYTAFIVFELYKEGPRHTVRLLYSNTTTPEDGIPPSRVMILPGCTEYCPFEYMEEYIKDLVPEDWQQECESK